MIGGVRRRLVMNFFERLVQRHRVQFVLSVLEYFKTLFAPLFRLVFNLRRHRKSLVCRRWWRRRRRRRRLSMCSRSARRRQRRARLEQLFGGIRKDAPLQAMQIERAFAALCFMFVLTRYVTMRSNVTRAFEGRRALGALYKRARSHKLKFDFVSRLNVKISSHEGRRRRFLLCCCDKHCRGDPMPRRRRLQSTLRPSSDLWPYCRGSAARCFCRSTLSDLQTIDCAPRIRRRRRRSRSIDCQDRRYR